MDLFLFGLRVVSFRCIQLFSLLLVVNFSIRSSFGSVNSYILISFDGALFSAECISSSESRVNSYCFPVIFLYCSFFCILQIFQASANFLYVDIFYWWPSQFLSLLILIKLNYILNNIPTRRVQTTSHKSKVYQLLRRLEQPIFFKVNGYYFIIISIWTTIHLNTYFYKHYNIKRIRRRFNHASISYQNNPNYLF